MREILEGDVRVSETFSWPLGESGSRIGVFIDEINTMLYLSGERFADRSDLVGKKARVIVEVDE